MAQHATAMRSASSLLQYQLPILQAAAGLPFLGTQVQPSTMAPQPSAISMCRLVRHYADGPDPFIVPLQKQQHAPTPSQTQEHAVDLPDRNRGPWERVIDKASGQPYWWNEKTGLTTPVGASKPDAWVAVVDNRTGGQYYWNKDSGETTAVGEPLPGPEGRLVAVGAADPWQQQQQAGRTSAVSVLSNSLAVGFGVGLVFALIRMVF